ncbi:MAG: transcriptional regulator [Moraxellaceae bacterium]|nr:MAG: transcriptional regulator [Moraxellaceae bacterium]
MFAKIVVVCILSVFVGFANAAEKRIGIIVWDGVLTSDVIAPLEVFGHASSLSWFKDYEVTIINIGKKKQIKTNEGVILTVDSHLSELPVLDVLIMPSAYDMSPVLKNRQLIDYVRETAIKADWMVSNCSGAFVLAEAGVLDGKSATTWAGGEDELQKAYPNVNVKSNTNLVVDEKVITSNGSLVSYQAALHLLSKIASPKKAQEVADAIQYSRFSEKPFNVIMASAKIRK